MRNKRLIAFFTLIIYLLATATGVYAEPIPSNAINIFVDGELVIFDVQPFYDSQNRCQVGVRFVAEALGYRVEWLQKTRQVVITGNDKEIILTQNSNIAIVNGQKVKMDTQLYAKEGRNFVPLRFVSEQLGCVVEWKRINKYATAINITTPEGSGNVGAGTSAGFVVARFQNENDLINNIKAIKDGAPAGSMEYDKNWGNGNTALVYYPEGLEVKGNTLFVKSYKDAPYEVLINPKSWSFDNDYAKKTRQMTMNILKMYFPKDYQKVYDKIDSIYKEEDSSKYKYKAEVFDGRQVSFNNGLYILIGYKDKAFEPKQY